MSDEPHDPLAVLRVPPTAQQVEKARANAWKAMLLPATLWIQPYVKEGDY
jgi:hypothetical protein